MTEKLACVSHRNNGVVRVTFATTATPQTNDFIGAFSPANTGTFSEFKIAALTYTPQ